jgi:hypothetical protein
MHGRRLKAADQHALRSYSWVDTSGMQALPDGPRDAGNVVLGMPASQIEVRITNSSYQKLAQ